MGRRSEVAACGGREEPQGVAGVESDGGRRFAAGDRANGAPVAAGSGGRRSSPPKPADTTQRTGKAATHTYNGGGTKLPRYIPNRG